MSSDGVKMLTDVNHQPTMSSKMRTISMDMGNHVVRQNRSTTLYAALAIVGVIFASTMSTVLVIATRPTHVSGAALVDSSENVVQTGSVLKYDSLADLPTSGDLDAYDRIARVRLKGQNGTVTSKMVTGYTWRNATSMTLTLEGGGFVELSGPDEPVVVIYPGVVYEPSSPNATEEDEGRRLSTPYVFPSASNTYARVGNMGPMSSARYLARLCASKCKEYCTVDWNSQQHRKDIDIYELDGQRSTPEDPWKHDEWDPAGEPYHPPRYPLASSARRRRCLAYRTHLPHSAAGVCVSATVGSWEGEGFGRSSDGTDCGYVCEYGEYGESGEYGEDGTEYGRMSMRSVAKIVTVG